MLEERLVLDYSAPPILQYFEGSYATIEQRAPDIFNAGYGSVLTPPPGRADSGNQSVGYDVYNRYDFGGPGNPTLYGTQQGLKAMIAAIHQTGDSYYSDLVWNHDGFSNLGTSGFAASGGYPGFALTLGSSSNYAGYNDIDGDFHSKYDSSTTGMRLAGLIDIAQEKNYQFIRSPVGPNSMNLPAGTTPWNGKLANVPDPNNAQYYSDHSLAGRTEWDPALGQNFTIWPYNLANPMNGTPTLENALGYLMRYTQYMVQVMGVDGFRLDAVKNMPSWVMNYFDLATYGNSFRTLLNGQQEPIFGFSEVFDGNESLLQQYYSKTALSNPPNTVGGNRDVLDFPLFFALQNNLTGNGIQNNWNNVINASVDAADDGLANNGSEGVSFVSSGDNGPPYLDNVAYAFTLTRPGNAIVYFNAQEFGTNRSFPKGGRGDALGGLYGNAITTLVNIRDTHPYGNFEVRDQEQNVLIYERSNSMLVGLSNRLDAGYDSRTVHTDFAPGTYLIELTGNAASTTIDPNGDIPPLLQVDSSGNVNMRVPRNTNGSGQQTNDGYVIYAPASPQGALTLTNVDHVIPAQTPTTSTNGTAVLSPVDVVTGNSFQIQLNTSNVNLLGNPAFHDQNANGDNAIFKIDGGIDVTGNGFGSTNPGDASYGFQQFTTVHNPGYFSANGNGQYVQAIDTSKLSNGMHYITVRAFRHGVGGQPPIFTDFTQAIYIDHGPTVSAIQSFVPTVAGVNQNQTLTVQSTDLLANNVHVFFDLPANLTNAQILSMISNANQANQIDRNLWTYNVTGLTNGNHVATVVSYQIDGNANVQRFPGLFTSTIFGAGLGDVNFDGQYNGTDITQFGQVLNSNNSQFNPAADLNGDGVIDNSDLLLLYPRLQSVGAGAATLAAYQQQLLGPPSTGYISDAGNAATLPVTYPTGTAPALTFSWDLNNDGIFGDVTGPNPTISWSQLNFLGIHGPGTYPIAVRVSDGPYTDQFSTTLTIAPPVAITITILPNWTVNQAGYNQSIGVSGGTGSYTYSVTGTLPAGLALTSSGILGGTPTAAGSYSFTVTATDTQGSTASQSYTVVINPPVTFTTTLLASWTANQPGYSVRILTTGGTGGKTFSSSGSLPSGLTLSSGGVLSGTPTAAGSYTFIVTATDSVGASGSRDYTVTINPPVTVTTTALASWTVNQPGYSQSLSAAGGTGSYTFTAIGTLPTGLTFSSSGALVGQPTVTGSFSFTVTATDAVGASGSQNYAVTINPAVSVPAATLTTWTAGLNGYNQTINGTGGTATLTFSAPSASLPPGLNLSSGGVLSGTPTTAGSFTFTVTATDSAGAQGSQSFAATINPVITITTTTLATWTAGLAGYSQSITASGGTGSLTFSSSGTLPTGLSLSNAGVLSGTPTSAGSYTFTVIAADSLGATGSQAYTVTINPSISFVPGVLATGLANTPYNKTITASGGTGTVNLVVTGITGAIPGINVPAGATGTLSVTGTPTTTGTEHFTLTATDQLGATFSSNYTITINPATVYLSMPSSGFAASPDGTVLNFPISINQLQDQATINHVGLSSATFAVTFPTGVFAFPTGNNNAISYVNLGSVPLSDKAGPGGANDWTLTATSPADGQLNITLLAKTGDKITTNNPANGGTLVLINFPVAGTYSPSSPTAQAITLVTTSGSQHTTITGNNGQYLLQPSSPYSGSVTVNPAVTLTTTSLPNWTANLTGYNQTLAASGGTGSMTFSYTGTLPVGLNLNPAGVLAGTPTAAGSYAFTVTATDSSGGSGSQSYTITINPAVTITTSSLADGTAGTLYNQTITATGGTGSLTFSTTGSLPAGLTLSGSGVLAGTPTRAGSYTFLVTATDSVGASGSQSFTVMASPGAFSQYLVAVSGSSTISAGAGFLLTIQAADAFGNAVTSYSGPATVTANVTPMTGAGSFPTMVSLNSAGLGFTLGALQKVGSYTITATSGSFTGSSGPINIVPGPAVKLGFAAQPVNTPTGVSLPPLTVQVQDAYGNVVTGDSSDQVILRVASGPGSFLGTSTTTAAAVNGVATFNNLTLVTPGSYTLSAVVPTRYTGPASSAFTLAPLQVMPGSFASSPSGFSLQFNAPYLVNSVTPALFGTGFGAAAPAPSVTLTQTRDASGNPVNSPVEGSLVLDPATSRITFVETDTGSLANNNTPLLPDGTYTVDVARTGFQALNSGGGFLDGLWTGTPGSGDFTTTFTVAAAAEGDDVLWVPATADGPGQPLSAPGMNQVGGGYPLYLTDTTGAVTNVRLTFNYSPALLTVTDVTGAHLSVLATTPGQVELEYNGPDLPMGSQTPIGFLTATVPAGTAAAPTPYKAKDLLHLSNVSLNGGTIPVATGDALHLVAYVGDADGNGVYSSNDAVLITRAALQADSGFAAYPLVDPVIVADIDGSGFIPADAALQVNEAGVGFTTANLPSPPIPSGTVFVPIANNVDPALSLASQIGADGILTVTVNIDDAQPAGSTGLTAGHLALTYDPRQLSVSADDIHLSFRLAGSGWVLLPTLNPVTGEIAIALGSGTPVRGSIGVSLVTIDFHTISGESGAFATGGRPLVYAPGSPLPVALVASVNPAGTQPVLTELEDAQGTFTLTELPGTILVPSTATPPASPILFLNIGPASSAATEIPEDLPPLEQVSLVALLETSRFEVHPLSSAAAELESEHGTTPMHGVAEASLLSFQGVTGQSVGQHQTDAIFQMLGRALNNASALTLLSPAREFSERLLSSPWVRSSSFADDLDPGTWNQWETSLGEAWWPTPLAAFRNRRGVTVSTGTTASPAQADVADQGAGGARSVDDGEPVTDID
jgi:hypothetical protein